jgi:hypothetical protein
MSRKGRAYARDVTERRKCTRLVMPERGGYAKSDA